MAVKNTDMSQNSEILARMRQAAHPVVYVNACTHGNERVGARVLEALRDIPIKQGTLILNIANEEAFLSGKRFIDQDLNRVFPGKPDGNTEERLAYELAPLVQAADIVLDIHSTESGLHESLIVTKIDDSTRSVIDFVGPKRVLVMSISNKHSLISSAKVGIAFEYGRDRSETTYRETIRGIIRILIGLGMTEGRLRRKKRSGEYYRISRALEKPEGFSVGKDIENFKLFRKGQVVAGNGSQWLRAPQDFYPILFGRNTYTDIFGFMGVRIENANQGNDAGA